MAMPTALRIQPAGVGHRHRERDKKHHRPRYVGEVHAGLDGVRNEVTVSPPTLTASGRNSDPARNAATRFVATGRKLAFARIDGGETVAGSDTGPSSGRGRSWQHRTTLGDGLGLHCRTGRVLRSSDGQAGQVGPIRPAAGYRRGPPRHARRR